MQSHLVVFSVPNEGPADVSAEALSSSTISVTWSSIPPLSQNGEIMGYKVHFRITL